MCAWIESRYPSTAPIQFSIMPSWLTALSRNVVKDKAEKESSKLNYKLKSYPKKSSHPFSVGDRGNEILWIARARLNFVTTTCVRLICATVHSTVTIATAIPLFQLPTSTRRLQSYLVSKYIILWYPNFTLDSTIIFLAHMFLFIIVLFTRCILNIFGEEIPSRFF